MFSRLCTENSESSWYSNAIFYLFSNYVSLISFMGSKLPIFVTKFYVVKHNIQKQKKKEDGEYLIPRNNLVFFVILLNINCSKQSCKRTELYFISHYYHKQPNKVLYRKHKMVIQFSTYHFLYIYIFSLKWK